MDWKSWTIRKMDTFYKYFIIVFLVLSAGVSGIVFFKNEPSNAVLSMNAPFAFAFSSKEADVRFGYDRFGIEKTDKSTFVYKKRVSDL